MKAGSWVPAHPDYSLLTSQSICYNHLVITPNSTGITPVQPDEWCLLLSMHSLPLKWGKESLNIAGIMALAKLTRHYLHGKPPYTSIYKWELETVQNHSKFIYNAHIYNAHSRHPSCLAGVQWIPLSYVSILSRPDEKPDMAMRTANCSPPFSPSTRSIPLQIVKIF